MISNLRTNKERFSRWCANPENIVKCHFKRKFDTFNLHPINRNFINFPRIFTCYLYLTPDLLFFRGKVKTKGLTIPATNPAHEQSRLSFVHFLRIVWRIVADSKRARPVSGPPPHRYGRAEERTSKVHPIINNLPSIRANLAELSGEIQCIGASPLSEW